MARPSIYTPELALAICEQIADGKSLRRICTQDKMPKKSTVLRWLADDAHREFRDQYARAREAQGDTFADEILEIADDASQDYRTVEKDGRTVTVFDSENVQRSRLRIDARKWAASKLAPKKYGTSPNWRAIRSGP